ncbi:MAG: hypothetical protein H6739_42260 [Alphaproteobacteria bacterium]|nr:hypothetical protein [Alphaproteobacteria bacterium]
MTRSLSALSLLFVSAPAFAFAEDLCFDGGVENCYDVPCNSSNATPACAANALSDAIALLASDGRSMLHMDATFFIAQALGFDFEDAHMLAAYNEATDLGQYVPFDIDGDQMVYPFQCSGLFQPAACDYVTLDISGVTRLSTDTGGSQAHGGAPFNPSGSSPVSGVDGQHPDVTDAEHELLLYQWRAWVFGDQDTACAVGITEQSGTGEYANGDECYDGSIDSELALLGSATISAVDYDLGEQILEDGTTPVVASDLDTLLSDPQLAKMGIYLHVLQDRVSHHICGDDSVLYKDSSTGHDFIFEYSSTECGGGTHALRHAWEVGFDQSSLSSPFRNIEPALEATWDELEELADDRSLTAVMTKAEAISALMDVLQTEDAEDRLDAMNDALDDEGFDHLPGH